MNFTWNPDKARKVKLEHKIDFYKLTDVFDDPFAVEFDDEEHSTDDESRYAIIGLSAEYGLIYLVFYGSFGDSSAFYHSEKSRKLDGRRI